MEKIDKIVFGDNQFFGINHMSQSKAQDLSEKFYNTDQITKVYRYAINNGINGFMLNSNEKAEEICNFFRSNKKYDNLNWYPSIPYPHKYASLVAQKGIPQALNDILLKNNSFTGILNMISKGSSAILSKDIIKLMQALVDIEMKIFKGLNIKVIFLQNIITDLLLGYELEIIFKEYVSYIKSEYNVSPGFITQNLPRLIEKLNIWDIEDVVICTSFNKKGYLMSPDIDSYIDVLNKNNRSKYQIMAMSTLASGAISPIEAYQFVNKYNIQSVVFGSSSEKNIIENIKLISENSF